jgi:GTP-binding protein EngB required for normal cell division
MNPFFELTNNIEESSPLIEKYWECDISALKAEIKQSINSRTLQIMLYGAYNAGKSTLINTLLGHEAATVNDIPTTFQVDSYDWEGFHLLDTPGVNAPIEHEEATEEQIKRSGTMLFVIRQGDQDAKDVYIRLFNILKRNKKIFIVLNHQLSDPEDKIKAVHKVNEMLTKLAFSNDINLDEIAKISVYPMNIRTAYTAKIKNSEKLLEHSGYSSFIQGFKQWVKQQDNDQRYLETLKTQISEKWYSPVISKLENRNSSDNQSQIKFLRDDRSTLESEQRSLRQLFTNFINTQVNLLKSDVSSVLKNSNSQSELDSKLQHVFLQLPEQIETWLSHELKTVGNKLSIPVKHNYSQQNLDTGSNQLTNAAINGAKKILLDQGNLKQALLHGRQLKIPGLKGRWENTLGQWAGKAAIAVQVATFFYEIYKANADQERENQRNRQQSLELYQAVEQICTTVVSDLTSSVHEVIVATLGEPLKSIQQQIDDLLQQETSVKVDTQKLSILKMNMLASDW